MLIDISYYYFLVVKKIITKKIKILCLKRKHVSGTVGGAD